MRLIPLSNKAHKVLAQSLKGNPKVSLSERKGDLVLVISQSGCFCVWVHLTRDKDWLLSLS